MPTRSRSRSGQRPAAACRASTWSSITGERVSPCTSFSHSGPRPGVPRPSAITTAKPHSANHCASQNQPCLARVTSCLDGPLYGFISTGSFRVPGVCQDGSSRAVRISRWPALSQVIRGVISGSAARDAITAAGRPTRDTVIAAPASVRETRTSVPPAAQPVCTPGAALIRFAPRSGS